jgi:predicted alpha/beta superfamily hydrolase
MSLIPSDPPLSATLPLTSYFEVDSTRAGARYAVWVTVPPTYHTRPDERYPAIYQPDGNMTAPMLATAHPLLDFDPIHPIRSFVSVHVGYAGDDAKRAWAVRARDLLPPDEPLLPGTLEGRPGLLLTGVLDQAGIDLYAHNLQHPAADRFLAFLTDELHPLLTKQFRIDPDSAGLFGYSYGGLFATYAAMSRSPLFHRIGAGSPGILPGVSRIFAMYRDALASGVDHGGRMLHMTICTPELTVPSYYQPVVAMGTAEFITLAGQQPLKGLQFSSHLISHESHATGLPSAWFSFLRTLYSAKPAV